VADLKAKGATQLGEMEMSDQVMQRAEADVKQMLEGLE
jgi:hypothetical protein